MKDIYRIFAYLALLTLVTTGFMFGSSTLFFILLFVVSRSTLLFWATSPLLLFMVVLEFIVFVLMMKLLSEGMLTRRLTPILAWRILWRTTWASFRIWQLAFIILKDIPKDYLEARRRYSLTKSPIRHRFFVHPIQERVNREFVGMCH